MRISLWLMVATAVGLLASSCCNKKCCDGSSQKSEKKASSQKEPPKGSISKEEKKPVLKAPQKKVAAPYNDPVKLPPFAYKPSKAGANVALFVPAPKDPVLKEMTEALKKSDEEADKKTKEIKEKHKKAKELKKENRRKLRADLGTVPHPKDLKEFTTAPHNPPVPQFYTGTCWSFASTSFFESEIMRLSKKKVKLSELWTVYHTYLEKARRYIVERGNSFVAEGDEPNAPLFIWERYGVVPQSAYTGLTEGKKRHDHRKLIKEVRAYLTMVKQNNLWDEAWNLKHIALILDKHLGAPPSSFTVEGKAYTAKSYLAATGLKLKDYVSVISTAKFPFYTYQELEAPDNWRKSKEYYNVPLAEWFVALQNGMKDGYTAVIGGDVSEPGKIPEKDLFFVPSFDIPSSLINQSARDFRIANRTTTDDHGIHLMGWHKGLKSPWFVFKDSGRSSRYGNHKGYYFVSGDYLRLKILTWFAHKDTVKELLAKAKK